MLELLSGSKYPRAVQVCRGLNSFLMVLCEERNTEDFIEQPVEATTAGSYCDSCLE